MSAASPEPMKGSDPLSRFLHPDDHHPGWVPRGQSDIRPETSMATLDAQAFEARQHFRPSTRADSRPMWAR